MNKKNLCFIHLPKTFCSFLTHCSSLCFGHFCATKPFTQTNCDEWIYNFCAFHSYLFYNDILSLSVTSTCFSLLLLFPTFTCFLLFHPCGVGKTWQAALPSLCILPATLHALPSVLAILQSFNPPTQYFDEAQDDHEYPYYYEETTGLPSSSPSLSPHTRGPNQQVKREQEGREA